MVRATFHPFESWMQLMNASIMHFAATARLKRSSVCRRSIALLGSLFAAAKTIIIKAFIYCTPTSQQRPKNLPITHFHSASKFFGLAVLYDAATASTFFSAARYSPHHVRQSSSINLNLPLESGG